MPSAKKQLKNKQNKLNLKNHDSLKKAYALKNNGDYNPNMYHDISNIIESGDYGLDALGNTISDQVIPGKIINLGNQLHEENPSEYGRGINLGLELTKNITPFWGDAGINALQKGVSYLSNKNPNGIDRAYENYFNNEKGAKYSNGGNINKKKLKYNKPNTYPTYEFPPAMATGGWLDQLPQQYAGGGDLPPMEVNTGLPKYGKKRVLNLKDYTKQNTTINRFPVVQNPFSRENKINFHLPENHGEEHRRLEVNPYFGGINVEPDLNVYYGGVDADLNLLNKNNNILDLRGGLNTGLVTYPGASEFTSINPSIGLSFTRKFAEGGSLSNDPTKPYHPTLNPDGYKGTIPPVDPAYVKMRQEAYNDSLNLYKAYQYQKNNQLVNPDRPSIYKTNVLKRGAPNVSLFNWNNRLGDDYSNVQKLEKDYPNMNNKKIADYYNTLKFNDDTYIGLHSSPDLYHKSIRPVGVYFDNEAWSPRYKKPVDASFNEGTNESYNSTPDIRQPYSPVQTNPNSTVQLPINNIPLQQIPTIGISEPTFEGNNAYWKKQDNQLIRQNNEYSNNMNLDISPELGDRFHQEPSWMVGEDKYYERDGKAYLVPQPKGGWKNKQILDPSSGKWKSKIVKKANGGWLDNL